MLCAVRLVVCCMLRVACGLLRCMLFVAYWLLIVGSCLVRVLFVVCCCSLCVFSVFVVRGALSVACRLLCVVCCVFAVCCLLSVVCCLSVAVCRLRSAVG